MKTIIRPVIITILTILTGCTLDSAPAGELSSELLWKINNSTRSVNIKSSDDQGILEDVQSVTLVQLSGTWYYLMKATGIPRYDFPIRQQDIDQIKARPDFNTGGIRSGHTFNLVSGEVILFGQDIGYNNRNNDGTCTGTDGVGGSGYWPPGPGCPTDQNKNAYFPQNPHPADGTTFTTGLGAIGHFLNGVSVFNWEDGTSYNNRGVWEYTAASREVHDLDICEGHSARGNYHHHFFSPCLEKVIQDDRDGHSPIYGYAADGYPIHGPWHSKGVLVKSSWRKRTYSTNTGYPDFGCGTAGKRTCTLLDPYDGVNTSVKNLSPSEYGPDTDATATTQSQHNIPAESGLFFQDHYYDANLFSLGGAYLDEHGGHDHDDLGYHYHLPLEDADKETPAFPYTIGPRLRGQVNTAHWAQGPPGGIPPGQLSPLLRPILRPKR